MLTKEDWWKLAEALFIVEECLRGDAKVKVRWALDKLVEADKVCQQLYEELKETRVHAACASHAAQQAVVPECRRDTA